MASSISFTSTPPSTFPCFHHKNPFPSFPISVPCQNPTNSSASALLPLCLAAKSQTGGPVKKRSSSEAGNKKRRKGKGGDGDGNLKELRLRDVEIVEEPDDDIEGSASSSTTNTRSLAYNPPPLPKPPAGFVVDDTGRVLMASNKRIANIVSFFFLLFFKLLVITSIFLAKVWLLFCNLPFLKVKSRKHKIKYLYNSFE